MKKKYKSLIKRLKAGRNYWVDECNCEHCDKIPETQDAAKALEELSAAYDELESRYHKLDFAYNILMLDSKGL